MSDLLVPRDYVWEDKNERRVSNWLQPRDGVERIDAGLFGAPLSNGSSSPMPSWAAPNAIRASFAENTTYSADYDVDLQSLRVRDLGNVRMHSTDPRKSQDRIESVTFDLLSEKPSFLVLMLGGDHSVSEPAVRGLTRSEPESRFGIIHFDAHNDVREDQDGVVLCGTPFRRIIETCPTVSGQNVVQLGLHGFMNSYKYKTWAESNGFSLYSARSIRKRGIEKVLTEAIEIASTNTDGIYLSIDVDVLSQIYVPGASGSVTPEGLDIYDVLESAFVLGQLPNLRMCDIVEINPAADFRNFTARTAGSILLTLLAGLSVRLQPGSLPSDRDGGVGVSHP
jgi:formiminoglutamase